ncbi:MAG: YajQ family cyclic di-GMP-binding protein [Pseudomonadota bacterium]
MPSFDIVAKTDLAEVDNAVQNMVREIATRYDFKGSKCKIERKDEALILNADDDLKLKQMHELLQGHMARRKIEAGVLEYKDPEKAAGQSVRQTVIIKQGIDKDLAKKIVKDLKETKLKVQAAIQGDEVRVTGKARDDLQDAIAAVKAMKTELPLQFVNFRD